VSDLPPPPPPPPGSGGPHRDESHTRHGDLHAALHGDGDLDWERFKQLATQWYAPLADRKVWVSLGYLAAMAFIAPALFAVAIAFGAVAFGLMFVFLVGLFLVVPWFRTIHAFNSITVSLADMAGYPIERRPVRHLGGAGIRSAFRALGDRERWRQFGFLCANAFLAPLFFSLGVLPLSIAWQSLWGGGLINWLWFDLGPLVGIPVAAVCIGLIPRVAIPVAATKARIDAWFLGTDRLAAAGQRTDILDAVAAERRRIERNLHDGVQQQLVAIGLDLGMAETHVHDNPVRAKELIVSAREKVQGSIGELRQLGRGLHPAILEDRGVDAALSAVVAGAPIPISVHVDPGLRLSRDVEEAVYFLANEAIANILKHSGATVASVHVMRVGPNVRVIVHDNGVGGASTRGGTGVSGMRARVRAVDGTFTVTSPKSGPTTLDAEIPLR
jgi:signal transduction histidine kinase